VKYFLALAVMAGMMGGCSRQPRETVTVPIAMTVEVCHDEPASICVLVPLTAVSGKDNGCTDIPIANPIITDASGDFHFCAANGAYRFHVGPKERAGRLPLTESE
jgi:hypothetical protein